MSWWVYLQDASNQSVSVEPHQSGGTYRIGGCGEAELNVTYNYSKWYHLALDKDTGLKWLHGKMARECIERLTVAVNQLGTKQAADYWASTRGNAGYALNILLTWARANPDAIFTVH
jgi:hypothetical protein